MCGIAGIYASQPVDKAVVAKMLSAIAYRGPDHTGVAVRQGADGGFLTVGQARLAIVDLSPEANQPFQSANDEASLTFNGEFYNFLDLRAELEAEGVGFRTRSDTEVALTLLQKEGPAALDRLWGMFAGAFYERSGRLLLFRDRLGKKPLYLYRHQGRLYFASEPKAILAVLDHVPPPHPSALADYLYLGYVPDDTCIFSGMEKLPAGHYLELRHGETGTPRRWYHPEREPVPSMDQLQDVFMDAVAKRMIADVPLAAFLSGGLDSSLVVAAMSRISTKTVHTFSVKFAGKQAFDESSYARMVADHCGTEHHEVVLDAEGLRDAVPDVLDHFDEPFGDSSAVPTWLVSRAARRQFTVALTGDGADEVFAGYRRYLADHYLSKLGPYALRRMLWKPLLSLLPTGRTNRVLETARRMRRLLSCDAPDRRGRHINLLHMIPRDSDHGFGSGLAGLSFSDVRARLRERLPADADMNDSLRFDQDLVLRDDMFVKIDRMSMKASLELRSPLVDHRLVALANGLSISEKLKGTARKRVLVERLGHLLPPQVLQRPKTGFEMPLGAWLRDDLSAWCEGLLFHTSGSETWFDRNVLREFWSAHKSGRMDCTEMIWYHLVLNNWLKRTYA